MRENMRSKTLEVLLSSIFRASNTQHLSRSRSREFCSSNQKPLPRQITFVVTESFSAFESDGGSLEGGIKLAIALFEEHRSLGGPLLVKLSSICSLYVCMYVRYVLYCALCAIRIHQQPMFISRCIRLCCSILCKRILHMLLCGTLLLFRMFLTTSHESGP
jgi:hypothetical protein